MGRGQTGKAHRGISKGQIKTRNTHVARKEHIVWCLQLRLLLQGLDSKPEGRLCSECSLQRRGDHKP